MSIKYLATDKIDVFPSTRRVNKQASARLISESSLVSIVNKLIETSGYVITPELEASPGYNANEKFEFNVYGYYFCVDKASDIINQFSSSTKIYANIYIDTIQRVGGGDMAFYELKGQDSDSSGSWKYQGVTFADEDLTQASGDSKADYSLLLFEKESTTYGSLQWVVPVSSRVKFNYSFSLGVDGGEI